MSTALLDERPAPPPLVQSFTATGSKYFHHQEAMEALAAGRGVPVATTILPSDICQHRCSFCSVQTRDGDTLPLEDILAYLNILKPLGLKAVTISGGGNPLLYHSPNTRWGISELILAVHSMGLEVGMITNGMKLRTVGGRRTYATLSLPALDALTWIRVSLAGLDHAEGEAYIPDVAPGTTLGFSWIYADTYDAPEEPNHGQVSTPEDLVRLGLPVRGVSYGHDRLPLVTEQITSYVREYHPRFVRLLPNCLEPRKIPERCAELQLAADRINSDVGYEAAFVQHKPPEAPPTCRIGYVHPVCNADGFIYPCTGTVLNSKAEHRFAEQWRVCRWQDVGKLYAAPVRSLVEDPPSLCDNCVWTRQNLLLEAVYSGTQPILPPQPGLSHPNFV